MGRKLTYYQLWDISIAIIPEHHLNIQILSIFILLDTAPVTYDVCTHGLGYVYPKL